MSNTLFYYIAKKLKYINRKLFCNFFYRKLSLAFESCSVYWKAEESKIGFSCNSPVTYKQKLISWKNPYGTSPSLMAGLLKL